MAARNAVATSQNYSLKNDRIRWGVVAVCLAAFAAIAIFADQITGGVPHSEDEVAYIFQGKTLAQNRLTVPTPANHRAFWTPFVVDYNGRRFGKYPPGWPALLSLGLRLNAPWLVNAGLGVLTLALIARLGRCFYRPQVGLGAAGLGLVTPGFLFLSGSFLSHPASLFWSTLALAALFCSPRRRQSIAAGVAGLALGAAFLTRPFAAVGIGAAVGGFLLTLIRRKELKWTVPALVWPGLAAAGDFAAAVLAGAHGRSPLSAPTGWSGPTTGPVLARTSAPTVTG